ncbi:MAG: hypothetical protein FWG90_12050 [Oscillospiraceae bacterium]|nr:hypothetical protein [Oscillospiraceae bacterium]
MISKKTKRQFRAEALALLEKSCRSAADFEKLGGEYDKLEKLAVRRRKRHEIACSAPNSKYRKYQIDVENEYEEASYLDHSTSETVIPAAWNHDWWRQLQSGNFLDFIYDFPFELGELTSNVKVAKVLHELSDNHKEIFYYRVVKRYSNRKIAEIRGQTDRNIRLLYDSPADHAEIHGL